MRTIAADLVTTTASTATSIHYAGQSQLIADGKLDAAETGQRIVVAIFFHARPAEINPSYAVGTKKTLFSPGNIQISLQKSRLHFPFFGVGLSLGLFLPKDFQFFKTDLKSPKAGIPFEKTGLESR